MAIQSKLLKNENSLMADRMRADLLQWFDAMGQGMVCLSSDRTISAANRTAEQLLDLPAAEMQGRNLADPIWRIIREDGSPFPAAQHPAAVALQTGQIVSNVVMGIFRPNEQKYGWVQITAKPEPPPAGLSPCGVYVTLLDFSGQRQLAHDLNERRKELQSFYSLSEIAEMDDIPLDELYQRIIDVIPRSWQYPEIAYGRLKVNSGQYQTANYAETSWKQTAHVKVSGVVIGFVEIGYLTECPPEAEGPFLREERLLLDALAERIGHLTERRRIARKLSERRKELQAFYAISEIAEMEDARLDYLYQRMIDILPKSWQYPEIACGKIEISGQVFESVNYRDTPWKQSADIQWGEANLGFVEIGYLEERHPEDEGPFLQEERLLLDSVAEQLVRITERVQTEELVIQAAQLGKWRQNLIKGYIVLDQTARRHFGFTEPLQNARRDDGAHPPG